jgi:hypothetical protein
MANNKKEVPPLSLIPKDEEVLSEDQKDSAKYCSFKLFTSPVSAAVSERQHEQVLFHDVESRRHSIKAFANIFCGHRIWVHYARS